MSKRKQKAARAARGLEYACGRTAGDVRRRLVAQGVLVPARVSVYAVAVEQFEAEREREAARADRATWGEEEGADAGL